MSNKNKPNYTLKDSLFIDLFSDKMRLIQLYKSLIDDEREISQDDIEILTIQNIILRGIYNDLGFRVKDEIIILMEAQTTYTTNIVLRILFYLSETLKNYIIDSSENKNLNELYNTKPRIIPKIKLFVVYTGDKIMQDHDLYLKDVMVENDIISDIDMKVRVLCTGSKNSILGQYILFTQIYTKQKKECKDIETAVKNTIEICMNDDILKEYLDYRKMEVQEMITAFTTQEEAFESFLKDEVKRGRKEGEEKGKMDTLINFFKNGVGLDVISKGLGMSIDEVKSILIGRGFEV
ncbi:hypothetical protein HMPREF1142_1799 [Peptostreptococcaceae bacterium AS15]|nr:hypothetical protein HMPREF1142_1799 [Peptostreptococcaceae bacterium AS15]